MSVPNDEHVVSRTAAARAVYFVPRPADTGTRHCAGPSGRDPKLCLRWKRSRVLREERGYQYERLK